MKLFNRLIFLFILIPYLLSAREVVYNECIEHFIPLPLVAQSTDYTCGPAAVLSILGYYEDRPLEADLACELHTNPEIGTFHEDMVRFFQSKGYSTVVKERMTLPELKGFLDRGVPVLCLIQAWDEVENYEHHWAIGHYVIAIGYDASRLYFMDPWLLGHYGYIPTEQFVHRWHQLTRDKVNLHQWGMAIMKDKPAYNPKVIKYIE